MMHGTALRINVAKRVFQLHGVDDRGQVVIQKRVSRSKLREAVAQLPAGLIGMEAWSKESVLGVSMSATRTFGETPQPSLRQALCHRQQEG